jgi:hypothetical protein
MPRARRSRSIFENQSSTWFDNTVSCDVTRREVLLLRQATYLLRLRFRRGALVRGAFRQLRSKLLPLFLPVTPPADFGWP